MDQIFLRPAVAADAEAIRAIYNHEVENTTSTFDLVPRSLEDQLSWQADRNGAFSVVVAVTSGPGVAPSPGDLPAGVPGAETVVGFGALSPYKERAAYRTTVEDSVYVRRDLARRGVGRLILGSLLDLAAESGFHAVMARISNEAEASIALHSALGFRLVGVEREVGRKFGRWLDVSLMQFLVDDPAH